MNNTANNESAPESKVVNQVDIDQEHDKVGPETKEDVDTTSEKQDPSDIPTDQKESSPEQNNKSNSGETSEEKSLAEAKKDTLESMDKFVNWCKSQGIPEIMANSNLTPKEKQEKILEIIATKEVESNSVNDVNGNEQRAEVDKTKKEIKNELQNKTGDFLDIIHYLAAKVGDWSLESADSFLKHDFVRLVRMIFGEYQNNSSGGEGLTNNESSGETISAELFFSYFKNNPREAADRLAESHGELAKLGWHLAKEDKKKLELAKKASPNKARELLQLILTGVSQSNEKLKGDSLASFLGQGTEDQQKYIWDEVGKIISDKLFHSKQNLSPEIKRILKNIKNNKENPKNYFF